MFTLFNVEVKYLGESGLAPCVTVDRTLELSGKLEPNQLYRIMDAGWFGFTRSPDDDSVVLYFRQDESAGGQGHYVAVTEDGEYRFGRTSGSPMQTDSKKVHLGSFLESSAAWGWLPALAADAADAVPIPGFVRDKLTTA